MKRGSKYFIISSLFFLITINEILTQDQEKCLSFPTSGPECSLCLNTDITEEGICIEKKEETGCLLQQKPENKEDSGCMMCKEGFALSENGKCEKNDKIIESCKSKFIEDSDSIYCDICEGGFPTEEGNCKKFSEVEKKNFENCIWGYLNYSEEQDNYIKECIRCKEGYNLEDNTRKCVKSQIEGCWIIYLENGENYCKFCDPWLEFYSENSFTCRKRGDLGSYHISL